MGCSTPYRCLGTPFNHNHYCNPPRQKTWPGLWCLVLPALLLQNRVYKFQLNSIYGMKISSNSSSFAVTSVAELLGSWDSRTSVGWTKSVSSVSSAVLRRRLFTGQKEAILMEEDVVNISVASCSVWRVLLEARENMPTALFDVEDVYRSPVGFSVESEWVGILCSVCQQSENQNL